MRVLSLFRLFGLRSQGCRPDPAQRFHDEYPLSLPGRLEFLERRLGLTRGQLLRLAGAPVEFAGDEAVQGQSWDELLAQQSAEHVERLAAVEAAIVDYLADINYDLDTAAAVLADMD